MNLRLIAIKTVTKLRATGTRATLSLVAAHLRGVFRHQAADAFDLRHGTDTARTVPPWKYKNDSPSARYGAPYQTVDYQALEEALKASVRDRNPATLTFVDIGCGKGRALIIASGLGFKQVIGVEFVHQLAEIARKNMVTAGVANAVVIEADAAGYRFPETDMVVYFFASSGKFVGNWWVQRSG